MSAPQIHVPPKIIYTREDGTREVFISQEKLGHGGFAVVNRVIHQNTNKSYAMKVISKDRYSSSKSKASLEKLKNEMQIQKSLNHPNVVQSKISFSDEFNHYIILEYCPGKSVREYLRKSEKGYLSEPEVRKILSDVIQGLVYLHNHRIIHHDIKLENFLIGSDGKVKIADFGISSVLKDENEKKYTFCGTSSYLSPEIIQKENKGHSFEVDIWALGVSAFIMLTGQQPFDGRDKEIIYEKIKNCEYHFPITINLSNEAKDFIKSILRLDPHKRPTASDLVTHPFMTKLDKDRVQLFRPPQIPQKVTPFIPISYQKVQSLTPTNSFQKDPCFPSNQPSQNVQTFQKAQAPSINAKVPPPPPPPPANNVHDIRNIPVLLRPLTSVNVSGLRTASIGIPRAPSQNSDEYEGPLKKLGINNNNVNSEICNNSLPCFYENNQSNSNLNSGVKKTFSIPNTFVTKYCFHHDDLGYLLGDGTVGICFKDGSRIIFDPHEEFLQFYKNAFSSVEIIDLDDYTTIENSSESSSDRIQKKILLVRKMAKSFKKMKNLYDMPVHQYDSSVQLHHVKHFLKRDDSILFKLNDKNVQVNFNDHKKLIIFWKINKMCIVRVLKEKCCLLDLSDVIGMNSNCDEFKKYKNAREMLAYLSKKSQNS
ncbi:hypothetical protein M9Y10_003574 [Tritrichomonas musculus]|uniref:Serine/threonine-protein kinase PLK n=1 Tax=Tritrichomonas musculus TaxID=1915356 RepID=A0ABR2JQ33_9EUKA